MPMMPRNPMMGAKKPMGMGSSPFGKMGGGMPPPKPKMGMMGDKPPMMDGMNSSVNSLVKSKLQEALMSDAPGGMALSELENEISSQSSATPMLDKVSHFYDTNYDIATDSGAQKFDDYASDPQTFLADVEKILGAENPDSIKNQLAADRELQGEGGDMMASDDDEMSGPMGAPREKPGMPPMGSKPPMGGMPIKPPMGGGGPPMGGGGGRLASLLGGGKPTVGNGDAMDAISNRRKRKPMGMPPGRM